MLVEEETEKKKIKNSQRWSFNGIPVEFKVIIGLKVRGRRN